MELKTNPHIQRKRKLSDANEETIHPDAKHLRTDDGATSQAVSYYEKREGTSGFGGLLYATKLQALVLLRALTRKQIERFLLGSTVHHIGAFDDLVLKFYERGQTRPKLLLVQTKHKDDPKKHNITIGEVNNKGGDINIKKHFQSYLQIKSNFRSLSEHTFLDTNLDEMDHEFIIYTNAENDLSEKEVEISTPINVDDILYSGQEGKILRFKSHYMEPLQCTLMEWRIARLAESLANFVLSDSNSYSDMMSDEFIKCYHPLLARHVLHVSTEIYEDKSNENETKYYRKSKFLSEFINTDDDTISLLRETLYKKIATHTIKSPLSLEEILNVIDDVTFSQETINKLKANKKKMKIEQFKNELKRMHESPETITEAVNAVNRMKFESLLFKVPSNFGNLDCAVISQIQLDDICTKITKLYKNLNIRNGNVIRIDRNSIDSYNILNDEDIEIIGTFVGNLLVLDEETQMFIFNVDENSLLKRAKQCLGVLESKLSGINDYKFLIDVYEFPRLSLYNRYTDDNIVKHFLNNFKIYTNQANECGVEELLIGEISKYYNNDNRNKQLRIKNRAIFLKVHDDIQKWWKLNEKIVPCLDENCKFIDQAKSDTNPLLTILNIMYTDKFKKNIEFEYGSIEILKLCDFMTTSDKRILHIVSEYHVLTAIKLNQYFNINNPDKYRFVDLDYVMKKRYYSEVCDELNNTTLDVVIIKYQEQSLQEEFLDDLMEDIAVKKIIFISDNSLSEESAFIKDERNNLVNLTFQSQENVLESIIIYQGEETPLSTIIDDEAKCLVHSEVLNKLVNNETITIGKTLTNKHYESIESYYIDRQLYRFIKINKKFIKCDGKINEEKSKELHVVYDDEQIDQLKASDNYDIMLISNEEQHFNKLCKQYPSLYIHWFKRDNKDLVWEKSRGRLKRIFKYIDEDNFEDFFVGAEFGYRMEFCNENLQLDNERDIDMPEPKKITDIEDKIVIISGEPGMGKSTLLTHLSIGKKKRDTSAWIVKVNLVDLSSEFKNWQKSEINYDNVVRFLYKAIDFQAFNENDEQSKKHKEKNIENILSTVTVNDNNEITLNKKEKRLQGSNLFEIEVFNYLHNRGRYIILLDGFDDIIPDYKKEVIDLLNILKQSQVERLWITTRSYNIQTELEDTLHTFCYVLEPFSSDDQMKFLEKFWMVQLELDEMKDTSLKTFYRAMMTFYDSFTDHDISFTSIPIHIYMIARIFKDTFKEYYDGNMKKDCKDFSNEIINNMGVYLYEQYIDIKVREIFFEKKIQFKNMDDPSMNDIVENKKQQIIKSHKLLAIHTIFNTVDISGLLSKDEENQIYERISKIESGKEKMGFVDRVVNGQARFVHTTFAEYFAALFMCDVVRCNSNPDFVWEFMIEMVFKKFHNVRIFFDKIMACNSELNNFISRIEHKKIIFNLLIKQGNDPLNSTTAISHAFTENLENILRVLMNSLEGNVNEDNLDDFIHLVRKGDFLSNAIEARRKDIAENIFRIVKEIDRSKLIDIVHYKDEYTEFIDRSFKEFRL